MNELNQQDGEEYLSLFEKKSNTVLYAEVIVPLYLPKNYTWLVPEELHVNAQPGLRVEVQLKNKKYTGIIRTLHNKKPEAFDPRPLLNILDSEPLVYQQQLELWSWIANYYMCTEGEVMQAAVPSNLKLSSESILIFNEEYVIDAGNLSDEEFIVAEALSIKKELRLSDVQQLLDASHVYPVIKKLIDKQVCIVWEELKEKYKDKTETYINLNSAYHKEEDLEKLLNNWSKAPKQLELLLSFLHLIKTEGEVTQTALLKKSGATAAQLKGLTDKNVLVAEKRSVDRLFTQPKNIDVDFILSAAQEEVLQQLKKSFTEKQVCLLHGVTSSGKTQVYIKLIEDRIKKLVNRFYTFYRR